MPAGGENDANRKPLPRYTVTLDLKSTPPKTVEKIKEKGIQVNQFIPEFGIAFIEATKEKAAEVESMDGVRAVEPERQKTAL